MMDEHDARLDEELDAILDGRVDLRASEHSSELEPAVRIAELLGEELKHCGISPEVAARHIAAALIRPLAGPAIQPTAVTKPRWLTRPRRRALRAPVSVRTAVVASLLGALLAFGPAVAASAHALPGEPLYGMKRAIEQAQLVIAVGPEDRAEVRTSLARVRLVELQGLVARAEVKRLPQAILALQDAVATATRAVDGALRHGIGHGEGSALVGQLQRVEQGKVSELRQLVERPPTGPPAAAKTVAAIAAVVLATPITLPVIPPAAGPTTSAPTTTSSPTTTEPTTTSPPPPTTEAPGTSAPPTTATPGSTEEATQTTQAGPGASGASPTTTAAA